MVSSAVATSTGPETRKSRRWQTRGHRPGKSCVILVEGRKRKNWKMIYCIWMYMIVVCCPIFKAILLYTRKPERCPRTIRLVSKLVKWDGIKNKMWMKTVQLQHASRDHRRKLELASVDVPRHCGFPFAGVEPKQGGNPPAWGVCHCNHRVCSACLVACAPHGYNQANPWRLPDKDFYWTKFQLETGSEFVWKH